VHGHYFSPLPSQHLLLKNYSNLAISYLVGMAYAFLYSSSISILKLLFFFLSSEYKKIFLFDVIKVDLLTYSFLLKNSNIDSIMKIQLLFIEDLTF
jgi:hypothetical protein